MFLTAAIIVALCAFTAALLKRTWLVSLSPDCFAHKIVLVTGGNSGLGRELAHLFHQCGATVVVWDLADSSGFDATGYPRVHYYQCDVTDREAVRRTARAVSASVGPIDVLVNNAGVVSGRSILDEDDGKTEQVLHVNCLSHFWTVKAFLPEMLERNSGHIVTVASVLGLAGSANMAPYITSKFGAFGFAECLRLELYRYASGVGTTLVCPGHISTPMFRGIRMGRMARLISPSLCPAYVARRTARAVLTKQPVVVIPYWLWLTILVRALAPVWLFDYLLYISGSLHAMDQFTACVSSG